MSLLSDIGTAIKNKLGGTSVDNTVPRYDGTTCKLQGSGVTISDTNAVTASGGFIGNASTSNSASGSSFFTSGSGGENKIGCKFSGYDEVYLFNNEIYWGVYSASGGSAFNYTRSTGKFNFYGNAETATNANNAIGYNQTWQDVRASRASGVTYTNTTGKPIMVAISLRDAGAGSSSFEVSGARIELGDIPTTGMTLALSMIVPNGATYRLNMSGAILVSWAELR